MTIRNITLLLVCVQCWGAQDSTSRYTIGPGDEVSIRVLDSVDISDKPVRVDPDGQIAVPLIGRIQAAGKSVAALETDLTDRLRTYIVSPQVSVNVTDFGSQPVSVLGAVGAPGLYQLSGAKPLAQVIAMAKGLASDAGGRIRISSYGSAAAPLDPSVRFSFVTSGAPESGNPAITEVSVEDLLSNSGSAGATLIRPYDVITVSKAQLVYVIGEVHKPGGHVLSNRDSVSVLEAISMAEGTLTTASPQHARLLRRDPNNSRRVEIPIDLKGIIAGRGDNMLLQPDDVLIVPKDMIKAVGLRSIDAAISLGTGFAIWR